MTLLAKQRGLSIIELLVALAIGSFLILGVTQLYIDNKRTYAFQQNQSENLESSRFTLLLLQQELAKAGYRRRPDEPQDAVFPASNAAGCNFAAGQVARWDSASSICIRYQPHTASERDCQGDLPVNATALVNPYTSAREIYVERFFLEGDVLRCRRARTDQNGNVLGSPATQSVDLVNGVADLRFSIGVGSASNRDAVTGYQNSDPGNTPILAIRYTALLRSSNPHQRDGMDATSALANWRTALGLGSSDPSYVAIRDADQGQLYQIAQNTVMLRNQMP